MHVSVHKFKTMIGPSYFVILFSQQGYKCRQTLYALFEDTYSRMFQIG